MNIFDEKRAELEKHEFMMGLGAGRLAVALDLLTDSLIMVGQHGVYCASEPQPFETVAGPAGGAQRDGGGEGTDPVSDGRNEERQGKGTRD